MLAFKEKFLVHKKHLLTLTEKDLSRSHLGQVVVYFASIQGDPGLNPGRVGVFLLCTLRIS